MAEIRKHNRSLTREQAFAQSVLSENTGTVYFTTDSHTIIMNGVEYSKSNLKNLEGYFTDDNAKFNYRSTAGSQSVASQANGDLATIEALYGDSLVWNQMIGDPNVTNTSRFQLVNCTLSNGTITKTSGVTFYRIRALDINTGAIHKFIVGHKYCFVADVKPNAAGTLLFGIMNNQGVTRYLYSIRKDCASDNYTKLIVLTPSYEEDNMYGGIGVGTRDTDISSIQIRNWQSFDLSLMFGLGKEPTLAQFEAWLANYFPRKDYAYNEGEVLSIKSNGIKTIGFNLWDEEWEVGTYDSKNGEKLNDAIYAPNKIRNKNYIRVLPNTTYYVNSSSFMYWEYDSKKDYIKYSATTGKTPTNGVFTTGENCYFINFRVTGSTYNNDICINLAWSGNRNGEYEEYWSETTPIPITTREGTKSDGTREVMFPDGLIALDDVRDEIKGNKAIKRIGKFVPTTNTVWTRSPYTVDGTEVYRFLHIVSDGLKTNNTKNYAACGKYASTRYIYVLKHTNDKQIALFGSADGTKSTIGINDDSYTDVDSFKAAIADTPIYYVLDEPIEYTLDQEFKVDYKVDDYGTEEILPENETTPTSLPIIADIRYGINAVDTLARLHKDYVSVYPQEFNDEQKKQARKNIGINDTSDTSDLNNTLMRLMVIRDPSVGDGIYRHNLCVSQNASRFIDAGYKPVIYRRMKVKRNFASCGGEKVWKWVPFDEVVLTPLETSVQQSEYMKIGVPNLLLQKAFGTTASIASFGIPVVNYLEALGLWNYGSTEYYDDDTHYYAANDFVIESCPDYIVDYWQGGQYYSQTDSQVYACHGNSRKTLHGYNKNAFKITLQYGFAFVEGSDITSKRVTEIIPFQLVHTPLDGSTDVTPDNKGQRWKFRLR